MVSFVKYVPTATRNRVAVSVREIRRWQIQFSYLSPLFPSACRRWMRMVHEPFIEPDPERVDQDWDWFIDIPMITFGIGVVRRPRMFQLHLAGGKFPLGMVALLENERWVDDVSQSAVYLWYLTAAPARAFGGTDAPKLLTAAALDIAITVSLNGAAQGRLWLHADPKGGEGLPRWYESRGLDRIPDYYMLPGPAVSPRINDGRYFRLTTETAPFASASMDEYRN